VGSPSRIFGDPHFVGLHGQRFKVNGLPGKVYNLFSSPDLQFNALFLPDPDGDMIVMAEFGIKVRDDAVWMTRSARLQLNGKRVPHVSDVVKFADKTGSLLRDIKRASGGPQMCTKDICFQALPRGYEIDMRSFYLKTAPGNHIHGLLGQTWNMEKWPMSRAVDSEITNEQELFSYLEGQMSDYEVKDGLFGDDFKFNRFSSSAYALHPDPPLSQLFALPQQEDFEEEDDV